MLPRHLVVVCCRKRADKHDYSNANLGCSQPPCRPASELVRHQAQARQGRWLGSSQRELKIRPGHRHFTKTPRTSSWEEQLAHHHLAESLRATGEDDGSGSPSAARVNSNATIDTAPPGMAWRTLGTTPRKNVRQPAGCRSKYLCDGATTAQSRGCE